MLNIEVKKQKRIAIVAHDNRKDELLDWLEKNIDHFKDHQLCGTGTTSTLIKERFNLDVYSYAQQEIDILFFFWDPLEAQPHDPDVKALLRIAVLYDIPVAQSVSGAEFIISSPLFTSTYTKHVQDASDNLKERVKELSSQL